MINTLLKEQGWTEGRNEGWTAGLEEGRTAGLAEGRKEGKIQQCRDLLLLLLPKKFGSIPPELESRIRGYADLDRMNEILARLLEFQDWQEIAQLLNGARKQ